MCFFTSNSDTICTLLLSIEVYFQNFTLNIFIFNQVITLNFLFET